MDEEMMINEAMSIGLTREEAEDAVDVFGSDLEEFSSRGESLEDILSKDYQPA
jgi:hypothetical protein